MFPVGTWPYLSLVYGHPHSHLPKAYLELPINLTPLTKAREPTQTQKNSPHKDPALMVEMKWTVSYSANPCNTFICLKNIWNWNNKDIGTFGDTALIFKNTSQTNKSSDIFLDPESVQGDEPAVPPEHGKLEINRIYKYQGKMFFKKINPTLHILL